MAVVWGAGAGAAPGRTGSVIGGINPLGPSGSTTVVVGGVTVGDVGVSVGDVVSVGSVVVVVVVGGGSVVVVVDLVVVGYVVRGTSTLVRGTQVYSGSGTKPGGTIWVAGAGSGGGGL
ncbi:hypothetical protein CIW51_17835 [Mycolicibacterium sp. P9-22]|nr:hypothetical protein CIW51_17835 [Mycolicibacterium sp. P9-22]